MNDMYLTLPIFGALFVSMLMFLLYLRSSSTYGQIACSKVLVNYLYPSEPQVPGVHSHHVRLAFHVTPLFLQCPRFWPSCVQVDQAVMVVSPGAPGAREVGEALDAKAYWETTWTPWTHGAWQDPLGDEAHKHQEPE